MPLRHARSRLAPALLSLALTACSGCSNSQEPTASPADIPAADALVAAASAAGMVRVTFPDPDPGIPLYARVGPPLNQFFHDGTWLAIPFYRDPARIPGSFNLLDYFDFPGPGGPGAFAAPLTLSGFYMIENGAPLGTFPKVVVSSGSRVPIWFVRWSDWQAAAADGTVTMPELAALPLRRGTATQFQETLRPRQDEHLVVINARGTLEDGRSFDFHVTHQLDQQRAIKIQFGR